MLDGLRWLDSMSCRRFDGDCFVDSSTVSALVGSLVADDHFKQNEVAQW